MFYRYCRWLLGLCLLSASYLASAQTLPTPASSPAARPTPPDSARTQALTSDTRRLRQLDSLRLQNTGRLAQLQQELLSLKNGQNRPRERELLARLSALRGADSLRRERARAYIDSLNRFAKGYPVAPHGDTIFLVYTKFGPFRPQERAQLTTAKILKLEQNAFFRPDSLRLVPSEQTVDLMYGEQVLQSLSNNDALWENVRQDSLAQRHRRQIIRAITAY